MTNKMWTRSAATVSNSVLHISVLTSQLDGCNSVCRWAVPGVEASHCFLLFGVVIFFLSRHYSFDSFVTRVLYWTLLIFQARFMSSHPSLSRLWSVYFLVCVDLILYCDVYLFPLFVLYKLWIVIRVWNICIVYITRGSQSIY